MIDTIVKMNGNDLPLPEVIRERYRLTGDMRIRLIETSDGLLVIPLTDEPMSDELRQELEEWQALGLAAWDMFPYEQEKAK